MDVAAVEPDVKFCVDCKHCKFEGSGKYSDYVCHSPHQLREPVGGSLITHSCDKRREVGMYCGPLARHFELKDVSLWQRLKMYISSTK